MDKRNYLIDLMRFFAAAWVALFHFNEPVKFIDNWYRAFLKLGYLGVPIFFVISGYCVYLAAEHSKTARDFIIRRFFRIFPPYWFSLCVVLATILISVSIHHVNDLATLPKTVPTLLATVSLLTAPFFDIQTISWVYWTLTFEIFFYLVIWASLLFPIRYKSLWLIFISVITLLLPLLLAFIFYKTLARVLFRISYLSTIA
jgi:peptidoglycan/LPS O-acetylase OafA/YrhL